ncbi:TPA: colanic acid biosynthesis protein WcaM, partial [Citrobacter werkmanii]
MSEKKLSRRAFLTAGSALVVLHSPVGRALESSCRVNIQDYNPKDWVASFRQAFEEGQTVVVPQGLECKNINTAIVIPPGKTLSVQGRISGSGRGRFVLHNG